jgi:hypothetical protein
MKLSEHLDLAEVTRSTDAKRKGISNEPTAEHIENFKVLAEKIFEPIRKHFGVPIFISSGYRSSALNKAIGGASSSQHLLGQAIDIDMDASSSGVTNKMIFEYIKNNLDFDQAINEFNYSWVHVSYNPNGKQRKQVLDAKKVNGKTVYSVHK